jgi:hypothetical protein
VRWWQRAMTTVPPDHFLLRKRDMSRRITDVMARRVEAMHNSTFGGAVGLVVDGAPLTRADVKYVVVTRQYMTATDGQAAATEPPIRTEPIVPPITTEQIVPVPSDAFTCIVAELRQRPLRTTDARLNSGPGRTMAFGIVKKRKTPPGYSRWCRDRPELYKLLLDFGAKHVPACIQWNSIQVNQNYMCNPHRDRGNLGCSWLVGFGDYTGGKLGLETSAVAFNPTTDTRPAKQKSHEAVAIPTSFSLVDVRHRGLSADFCTRTHWVQPFVGERMSMVFYHTPCKTKHPAPSVRADEHGRLLFYTGDTRCSPYKRQRAGAISAPAAALGATTSLA